MAVGEVILTVPKVILIKYENSTSKIVEHASNLDIVYIEDSKSLIFTIKDWNYLLHKHIPIATNKVEGDSCIGKKYFFPEQNKTWCVVFGDDITQEMQNDVEAQIEENSILYFPEDPNNKHNHIVIEEVPVEAISSSQHRVEGEKGLYYKEGMDAKDASKGLGYMLSQGGDFMKNGIIKSGNIIGEAFEKSGDWIKGFFSKNEKETQVKSATIDKLRLANKTSGRIKEYTTGQIKNMIDFATGLASDAIDEMEKMEVQGTQLKENKIYIHTANIGKGVLHVMGGVMVGMGEAFGSIVGGIGKGAQKVVEHKYGPQVGDAMGIGLNIGMDGVDTLTAFKDGAKDKLYNQTHCEDNEKKK